MLIFHVITIFPEGVKGYFDSSILKRAQEEKRVKIVVHNVRDFSSDRHHKVDDRPFGGGPGMVMMVEPLTHTIRHIMKKDFKLDTKGRIAVDTQKWRIVFFDTKGELFTQEKAHSFISGATTRRHSAHIILICGHYEGIDERVKEFLSTDVISVGNYVLSGGEVPAMAVVDAVTRLVPGVLGNEESIEETRAVKGYAVYTRPREFSPKKGVSWDVPDILFSGDPKKIDEWRTVH
ncbi:MAG: tRNA (guanosine(37)-N1)-methyltransferase TrmD [Patescibacteria group bacterium]|nr:tRNA (guanosine(37)-N1)-methyltransferase TrmD [Patescibacteria group bacterium]MDE2438313.1 tRNA (guanosine(37)-N1)-methyltransferase TrmD [Patescibacteria group bacterium]